MNCLVVQHLEVEGPFEIGDALRRAGVEVDVARVFAGDAVPTDCAGYRGLVVMGGPMSARRDDGFGSRRAEIALLADAVARGLPVLGVCLGAQLLAAACGAAVRAGEAGAEIGWGAVELTEAASSEDPLFEGLPEQIPVLHWHSETFDLPRGAIRLAGSSKYPQQAFRVGERAWGFQFHLEVDAPAVVSLSEAFSEEALGAGIDPSSIVDATAPALRVLSAHRDRVLGRFASFVAASGVAPLDPAAQPNRSADFEGDSAALPTR